MSYFPGGPPGNRENEKNWALFPRKKELKLPEVLGFGGYILGFSMICLGRRVLTGAEGIFAVFDVLFALVMCAMQ